MSRKARRRPTWKKNLLPPEMSRILKVMREVANGRFNVRTMRYNIDTRRFEEVA